MEIQKTAETIAELLKDPEVVEFFSEAELKEVGEEMVAAMKEVLGDLTLEKIEFAIDDDMYFNTVENFVHLGMGLVKRVLKTFRELENISGSAKGLSPFLRGALRKAVTLSLKGDAAHEAGHRVIDLNPIKDLGLKPEVWGQLGLSSLNNSFIDCRNDDRIMALYPKLKPEMDAALEFSFGPGGRLDWPYKAKDAMLKQGYLPLFAQFDSEVIRQWAYGAPYPTTDPRVREVLKKHEGDIRFMAKDPTCVPKKKPSLLERKAKARKVYRRVEEIFKGDYQKLLERDRQNQAVHQAITIVGLHSAGVPLHPKMKNLLDSKLPQMPPELAEEMQKKLATQREEKEAYEKEHKPVEKIQAEVGKAIEKTLSAGPEKPVLPSGSKEAEGKGPSPFELIGPAVLVEGLSEPLREYLIKLFEEMQETMKDEIMQQMLSEMLQELLKDPEKFLKEIEDALNAKLRPHTKPPTSPTHQEMEAEQKQEPKQENPNDSTLIEQGGKPSMMSAAEIARVIPRELEEAERWLEHNIDIDERIEAWKEAIRTESRRGRKPTKKPTAKVRLPAMMRDRLRKQLGVKQEGKIFEKQVPKQEKITVSILWRTQAVSLKEALRLFLFLQKIRETPEVKRFLDLEILVSQKVPGISEKDDRAPIPVVVSFNQDPDRDYDEIMHNMLALNKAGSSDSGLSIVEDATALEVQRRRLLDRNRGSGNRFAIDLWDEAAIQHDSKNPMQAVYDQIDKTQEELDGKAFCFVLKSNGASPNSPGNHYGKDHWLEARSTKELIERLDLVILSMLTYKDGYATHVKEEMEDKN